MRKLLISCLAAIALLSSSSCGGGGGGDDAAGVTFLGGIYKGILTRISDTCEVGDPPTIAINWTVNQTNSTVALASQGGLSATGSTIGNDSFQVNTKGPIGACTADYVIVLKNITSDKANATYSIVLACPTVSNCDVIYSGDVSRSQS
ncbi:hypothetical protein OAO01_05035 [Oligoflexia bacterium]|nr:hypothetical protein [Oligoflexia bacterium]